MKDKLEYDKLIKSMQMFFYNERLDEEYHNAIKDRIKALRSAMVNINTKNGLKEYIINNGDSLENILCLLNVSGEFFKRIITMLRSDKDQVFDTEWSIKQTRKYILQQNWLMDKVCDLFINGADDDYYKTVIPRFNLQSFKIDIKTMARLANDDIMNMLIIKDFEAAFSSKASFLINKQVDTKIDAVCKDYNCFKKKNYKKKISGSNITIPFTISKVKDGNPDVVIINSFMITTGSSQTSFKNRIKEMRTHRNNDLNGATIVVIIDGAGWVARQSDLKDIHDYADYCINMKHLDEIGKIIYNKICL